MGKYSSKGLSLNPKRKKKTTKSSHKQRYWKKENKPIDKSKLYEVKGNREELQPYVGEVFIVKGFLTNSYKYSETKRLVNSVILPITKDGKNLYINHGWIRSEKTKDIRHGFKTFRVQVVKYKNLYEGKNKYGIKFLGLEKGPIRRVEKSKKEERED
jgi:hypothetical protein